MESFFLEQDIKVFYVKATSFPGGVLEAHQKLHSFIKLPAGRKFFGISYPEGLGKIVYKAAVEENYPGEAEELNCPIFVIKNGRYNSIYIPDFHSDIPAIGKAFQKLLNVSGIDPQGCCVEIYEGDKDVRCMVRLKQ